jgi:formyl-CoA transferase
VVDVSLFESVFSLMESTLTEFADSGLIRERSGGRLPGISPSNSYMSRDGHWVVIAGNGDAIFRRMMNAMGRPDLADDPALQTNDGRVAHDKMLDRIIAEWAADHTLEEILHILEHAEVPSSKIYSARDISEDAQYKAREMIVSDVLPDGGTIVTPGITPKLSATPGEVRWLGPALGLHTEEILGDLGYSKAEIAQLRARHVV